MKVKIVKLHCLVCGHSWHPKQTEVLICPHCKSARWNKGRLTQGGLSCATPVLLAPKEFDNE